MKYQALATDYDGTLSEGYGVDSATMSAVERLRASGRRAFLVTGRRIDDLRCVFSRLDLFDAIVAENGALLYYPSSDSFVLLEEPPAPMFTEEMKLRGVNPLSIGHVMVATSVPYETVALDVIKEFGLELEIIFNKGSVMILPSGVNKATGLAVALKEQGIQPQSVVAIGDAENDHAFLSYCGFGVAVSNALESLKEHADLVINSPAGKGVVELIDLLIKTDLHEALPVRWRVAPA